MKNYSTPLRVKLRVPRKSLFVRRRLNRLTFFFARSSRGKRIRISLEGSSCFQLFPMASFGGNNFFHSEGYERPETIDTHVRKREDNWIFPVMRA